MIRFLTAGESHGPSLTIIVEGLPSNLPISIDFIQAELQRRRLGYGRGPRMRFEVDEIQITGGVRHGVTIGAPVSITIVNTEWNRNPDKWQEEMSVLPGESKNKLTTPRPGHADLAGMQKYRIDDSRTILERASARETAARVVAGSLAKTLLSQFDIRVLSHVLQIGSGAVAKNDKLPTFDDLSAIDESQVRCFYPEAEESMIGAIKTAAKNGDSLGGIIEVLAYGVPVGLGSHVHWDRKIDGMIGHALMSIQAIKAVSLGDAISVSSKHGSESHDAIYWENNTYTRHTNHAGGIEGGITNGGIVRAQMFMKPLATLNRPVIETVDTKTKEKVVSFKERTDVTAVPAAGVVGETMLSIVLAQELQRKFGGDSIEEMLENYNK
jgi:chorismate synthase